MQIGHILDVLKLDVVNFAGFNLILNAILSSV